MDDGTLDAAAEEYDDCLAEECDDACIKFCMTAAACVASLD